MQIKNLKNDTPYAFAVAATDQIGNPGTLSQVVCNTPVLTTDFFEGYRADGGKAGCSVTESALDGAAPTCAFGVVGLALLRGVVRRRRSRDISDR